MSNLKLKRKDIKLAIVGSRDFTDKDLLEETIKNLLETEKVNIIEIISGGAKGADTLAEEYACDNKILIKIFYPDWETYGKRAGPIRNKKIVEYSDYVIAFWDGVSRGTKSSIDFATDLNKKLVTIRF